MGQRAKSSDSEPESEDLATTCLAGVWSRESRGPCGGCGAALARVLAPMAAPGVNRSPLFSALGLLYPGTVRLISHESPRRLKNRRHPHKWGFPRPSEANMRTSLLECNSGKPCNPCKPCSLTVTVFQQNERAHTCYCCYWRNRSFQNILLWCCSTPQGLLDDVDLAKKRWRGYRLDSGSGAGFCSYHICYPAIHIIHVAVAFALSSWRPPPPSPAGISLPVQRSTVRAQ